MKVLWLCNRVLARVLRIRGENANITSTGGWLDGISDALIDTGDVELGFCLVSSQFKKHEVGTEGNFSYFLIPASAPEIIDSSKREPSYAAYLKNTIQTFAPDVIHIFGTEYKSTFVAVRLCKGLGLLDRVVISIQGLVSKVSHHYFDGMEFIYRFNTTFQDFVRQISMKNEYSSFKKRGLLEDESLRTVKHVIGRTDWDHACVEAVNPSIHYHFCNETFRGEFYTGATWNYANCNKHVIYVSQAGSPIKGFHMLLKALPVIVRDYPDVVVKVAGYNRFGSNYVRGSGYYIYLQRLIKKYHLQDHIQFLGPLSASQVREEMLKANVLISSSNIENSPNSLGEAMILGVPCISSDVGGVKNLMKHEEEGYIYPVNEYYMIPYYVKKVFESGEAAENIGAKAKQHAMITHDREINNRQLLNIYNAIDHHAKE